MNGNTTSLMQTYLGSGSMKECFLLLWSTDLLKPFFVTYVVPEVMTQIFHALVIREIIIAPGNLLSLNSTVILFFGRFSASLSASEKYNYFLQNQYLNYSWQNTKSVIFFLLWCIKDIFIFLHKRFYHEWLDKMCF
jgi:hypothetical protein